MALSFRLFLIVFAMLVANQPSIVDARRGGGKRPQGGNRPQGGFRPQGGNRPQLEDALEEFDSDRPMGGNRPQGGDRPPRGPPSVGVFSISAEKPELLGSIAKSRGVTLAPVNGLTAVYESKLDDPETPPAVPPAVPPTAPVIARSCLYDERTPENMKFFASTSNDGGATWTTGEEVVIANLPADVIARKPTLSADGTKLFFVGASGSIKDTPSAIHYADCTTPTSCAYAGKAFEQPGKIVSGCAFANGKLIVPVGPDMKTAEPPTADPLSRRSLLRRKGPKGSKGEKFEEMKELVGKAWVSDCDFTAGSAVACKATAEITMPAEDDDAMGRGPSAFRGSMIYANDQFEFYGSGKGAWPVVSKDATTWTRSTAAVDLPGPDPSCAKTSSDLVCAAFGKKRRGGH